MGDSAEKGATPAGAAAGSSGAGAIPVGIAAGASAAAAPGAAAGAGALGEGQVKAAVVSTPQLHTGTTRADAIAARRQLRDWVEGGVR